jgi:membrane protease subunit HflC
MKPLSLLKSFGGVVLVVLAWMAFDLCTFSVSEIEQVIVTEFGKPVGGPITQAGLHWRTPFVQTVNRIEKRILEWDGRPSEMPTRDKLYVVVDAFGRWRIQDPAQYFTRLRDERSALSRLDDIIGSELRNAVAKNDLIELVRTTIDRKAIVDPTAVTNGTAAGELLPIRYGRAAIEREILAAAAPKLKDFGIELLDVRFMRLNYNANVSAKVHERMVSERQQIASRFRSEGEGEAAIILGNKERELRRVESEAYREVQKIRGEADAKASEIYAAAYGQSPQAAEFYGFLRTMQTYQKALGRDTTLMLSTDSDFFRYLKQIQPTNVLTR